MKVWKLYFELNKYDSLVPESITLDELQSFDGRRKKDSWRPLSLERMEPGKKLELSDAPGYNLIIFSKKALNTLSPLIQDSIEELEVLFEEGEYYAINVTTVLDVIDYSKSRYITFDDGKKIMVFEKYAFKLCDELIRSNIFKIIDETRGEAFVSDRFKESVEKNNLTGFRFELVWDSERE